jgi:Dna[CI] antecedent, DciA
MDTIGSEVRRELARFGPAAGMGRIVEAWPSCVGESVARNAWPSRLSRDGTLHVSASSSAWAFELGQLEPTVRGRLEEALGDDAPVRLRFAPGRLPEPDSPPPEERRVAPPAPGPEDLAAADAAASVIEDDELRELVARAAAVSLAQAAAGRAVW